MKKLLGFLMAVILILGTGSALADGNGMPYGDSDGVIPHDQLAGLYRWMCSLEKSFRTEMTFDDIGAAVGKAGHDRRSSDGKTCSAEWTDGEKYFVVVTFKYREEDDKWTVTSVSTGLNSDEYKLADVSGFPHIGNRDAGSSPTEAVTLDTKVKGSDVAVQVTADVPTENWYPDTGFGKIYYYLSQDEKNAKYSYSRIVVSLFDDMAKVTEDLGEAVVIQELDPVTVDGVELQGFFYEKGSDRWTEYCGSIADGAAVLRIQVNEMLPLSGTEAEALIKSLKVGFAE